jgi:hypothetical protein
MVRERCWRRLSRPKSRPGDFEEALLALLGKDVGGLSASTIGRLKDAWSEEHLGPGQPPRRDVTGWG